MLNAFTAGHKCPGVKKGVSLKISSYKSQKFYLRDNLLIFKISAFEIFQLGNSYKVYDKQTTVALIMIPIQIKDYYCLISIT